MATEPNVIAVKFSPTLSGKVLVYFEGDLNSGDANTSTNYLIPGLVVSTAVYTSSGGVYLTTLTVTGAVYGTSYTLTVINVRDVTNTYTIAPPKDGMSFLRGAGRGIGVTDTPVYSPPLSVTRRSRVLSGFSHVSATPVYSPALSVTRRGRTLDSQPFIVIDATSGGGPSPTPSNRSHNTSFNWGFN